MKYLVVFLVLMAVLLGSCDIMTSSPSSSSRKGNTIDEDMTYYITVENLTRYEITYVFNGKKETLLPRVGGVEQEGSTLSKMTDFLTLYYSTLEENLEEIFGIIDTRTYEIDDDTIEIEDYTKYSKDTTSGAICTIKLNKEQIDEYNIKYIFTNYIPAGAGKGTIIL
jgi:hypothetical protein